MPADRFDKLEGPLPEDIRKTLSGFGRFDHLEIGTAPPPPPPKDRPRTEEKVLCLHCGQANEKERQTCWACFRPLKEEPQKKPAPKGPEDITIVLDGLTYHSTDPNLPSDVKTLMDQIREKGFSQELLAQWRTWRVTRNEPRPAERPFEDPAKLVPVENQGKDPLTGNEVFKGQRSSVIRLDGKIYTSTDMELTPQMKELFQYIEDYGVTPALMEHLRMIGRKTTVRPATTPAPSVEDLAFWKDVRQDAAQEETPAEGRRRLSGMVIAAIVGLFIVLRLLSCLAK
ncbi:MAG: hypothetical protein HY077_17565 [Elusimicrobia bacterium]|nr:hypothetical protein [Elusimicrobiota bacterium]